MATEIQVGESVTEIQSSAPPEGDPISTFFTEIAIIEQLARTRLERVLPDGMKEPQFGVLNHMVRLDKKGESPAELASAFQVTRPTMTNTIQRLEAKGYVSVEPDPNDGRGKQVRITEAGRAAREKAIVEITPLFAKLVADLGFELFANTKPALVKIRTYMDENRD